MTNVMPIIKIRKEKAPCLCISHKQSAERLRYRMLFL